MPRAYPDFERIQTDLVMSLHQPIQTVVAARTSDVQQVPSEVSVGGLLRSGYGRTVGNASAGAVGNIALVGARTG